MTCGNFKTIKDKKAGTKKVLVIEFSTCDRTKCLPVASDGLKGAVISAERDVESNDGLASLDKVEVLLIDAGQIGGLVVEQLDLLEETRFLIGIELRAELLDGGKRANYRIKERKS